MGEKFIIKLTSNRRMSIPRPVCSLLDVSKGAKLEANLDISGEAPKLVLSKQRGDEQKIEKDK